MKKKKNNLGKVEYLSGNAKSFNTKDPLKKSQKESLEWKEKYPQKLAYFQHELIPPFSKHRHTYPV